MTASVLLDTSFLITLVNENRTHHTAAKQYYRHMLQNNVPMHFSSVVAAEFGIKQPIADLPLNNFRILNFNVAHAQEAATLWNALGQRDDGDARAVVRDDLKLLAQASQESIEFILTEDARTMHKYCGRLNAMGLTITRSVTLKDGFSADSLRQDGQVDWVEGASDDAD